LIDVFTQIIIPLAGLFIGGIGAWDKIVFFLKHIKNKRNERKLIALKKQLEELEELKSDISYLIAVLAKKLFQLLSVIFLATIIGSIDFLALKYTTELSVRMITQVIVFYIMSFLAGFIVGRASSIANSVIFYKKKKIELENKINKLQVGKTDLTNTFT